MKKVLNIFYWGIFATLLIIAGIVFLSSVQTGFPYKFLTVGSGSMRPSILPGSVVVVRQSSGYEVNDVITYTNADKPKQTITHRVSAVEYSEDNSSRFITKGDANEDKDSEKVAEENVLGKVILSVPFTGYLVSFTKTPVGLISLVIIPGILFVAYEIDAIKKEILLIRKRRLNYEN